jgi:CTP synthase
MNNVNFIFVVGGVISGAGKGTFASSLGMLLKAKGFSVGICKIDPYISMDAGNMRPTVHGEVFVSKDGGELDLDLGNYERFLDTEITKGHNITTGKVYQNIINKERRLEFGGNHAEVIPDIPNEVERMISDVVKVEHDPEFLIVELGGTVGDLQNAVFEYALADLSRKFNCITILITYIFYLQSVGEFKSKPTQHAMMALRRGGLNPEFLVCRSEKEIPRSIISKVAKRDFIKNENVFALPDLKSSYQVPIRLHEEGVVRQVINHFNLSPKQDPEIVVSKWKGFLDNFMDPEKCIKIGLIEKYSDIDGYEYKDAFMSINHALISAGAKESVRVEVVQIPAGKLTEQNISSHLQKLDGVIIPGGFGETAVEGKILAIQYARENNLPFLGICYGMQLAVVEFARNVCNLTDAHTTEVNSNTDHPVVDILPDQIQKLRDKQYGSSMRLGEYTSDVKKNTKAYNLYNSEAITERHRHRYEVNPEYKDILVGGGLVISAESPDGVLTEIIELYDHPFFMGVQFHPEFKSRPLKPHPFFLGLIQSAVHAVQFSEKK